MAIKHHTIPAQGTVGGVDYAQWAEGHDIDANGLTFNDLSVQTTAAAAANPTAHASLTAINGVAATFMRSDAAPALDQSISPTWTGAHVLGAATGGAQAAGTLNAVNLYVNGTAVSTAVGANPTASVGTAAVNGSAATFMRSDGAPAINLTMSPTWTATHNFTPSSGVGVNINAAASQQGLHVFGASGATPVVITAGAVGQDDLQLSSLAAGQTAILFQGNQVNSGRIGAAGATNQIISGSAAGDLCISQLSTGTLRLATNSSDRLDIDSSGRVTVNAPASGTALTVTGTANATTGILINGAAVSPSTYEAPVSVVTGQWLLQYQQLLLAGTDRTTLAGTARVLLTRSGFDFQPGPQGEAYEGTGQVVNGTTRTPLVNFVVPAEYTSTFVGRLTLAGAERGALQLTARAVVTSGFDALPGPQGELLQTTGQVVLGVPKAPAVSFIVPSDYVCNFPKQLILRGQLRASLAGTSNTIVFDDFGQRGRITLSGIGQVN